MGQICHVYVPVLIGSGFPSCAAESYQVKRVSATDKHLFLRSQHSSMINGLSGRYPLYGPVVQ